MKVFYKQRRFIKGDKAGNPLTTGWLPPLPDMRTTLMTTLLSLNFL